VRFEVVTEIEPATRPDLERVRRQIEVLRPVSDAFLVPDNHLGRATVSSVAVAHEVAAAGGRSIACVNARDRNLLGFRRDLLTAAAYGVDEFLLVYGDAPSEGARTGQLTVRQMLEEVRRSDHGPFRAGVTCTVGRQLAWKSEADFVFLQVCFDHEAMVRWRDACAFAGPVYAGVMVMASAAMARRIAAQIPEIAVPADLVERLESHPDAGVDMAHSQVERLRSEGAFAGVHLVPVGRYREMAARLSAGS
jgi:5,10-methylenetetrahydrofolate reductase